MARWPLMAGVSTEIVPAYGSTMGSDVPVTHRYQSMPELTKKCPREEFSNFAVFDRDVESRYGVENDEDDEPDR
jgi:hypothetical protein